MSRRSKKEPREQHLLEWIEIAIALAACAGLVFGFLGPVSLFPLGAKLASGVVILAACFEMVRRLPIVDPGNGGIGEIAAVMLWSISVWLIFEHIAVFTNHIVLIPALFLAWLVITFPLSVYWGPLTAIAAVEIGLLLTERQSQLNFAMNIAAFAIATFVLSGFLNSTVYRRRARKVMVQAKREADSREYARDLGLFNDMPAILNTLPSHDFLEDPEAGSSSAVKDIAAAFDLQLELIRQSLGVTTVALLWPDPKGKELRLRSIATSRDDILPGPYPAGVGISGALTGNSDIASVAPVTSSFSGLPYYKLQERVGSILAVRVPDESKEWLGFDGKKITAILCVDREEETPWSDEEKAALALAAKKVSMDVIMGRSFQTMAQERHAVQRVCIALRELNNVLGLEQVLEATSKVIHSLVRADFIAVSLLADGEHRLALCEGQKCEKLLGQSFALEEGLVGQVLKINRPLPAKAQCHGPMEVFGNSHRLTGYKSLLVLPLQKEEGSAVGALTVAAKEAGVFTRSRQEILELVAAQLAVKIDLGQAHEQINRLATTDGLTGLINHRTFQHGFDVMLKREERRSGSLCLILCDIDHFKKVNDTYGHPFGDLVLKEVAGVLQNAVRAVDLAARYGGEEFALVLEDCREKGGLQLAERIREEIAKLEFRHQGRLVQVSMSLGLAAFPKHGSEKTDLVSRADQALYQAKQSGRNRVIIWDESFSG